MREIEKAVCFLILCLLIIISSFGQAEEQEQKAKTKVMVHHEDEDTIGIRLAYEIKEEIRSSFEYDGTNKFKEADLVIAMRSSPIQRGESAPIGSAISVTFIYKPMLFNRWVHGLLVAISTVGDIESKAGDIVAFMDKHYQEQRANLESIYEALIVGLKIMNKKKN